MGPVKKIVDKLTDSEKKKVKQGNKAKANPKQAAIKAETNLKRRINRGQEQAEVIPGIQKQEVENNEELNYVSEKKVVIVSDEEKIKRKLAKREAILKEFANAKGIVRPATEVECVNGAHTNQ